MPISKSAPIAIIGAGVFGLSTALQLASDGYTNITVFEKDDQIPPRSSAGFDLNKIVRAEYEDPWYTENANTAQKAIEAWKTPLYAPHYHQTGFLHLVSGSAPQKAVDTLTRFLATVRDHPKYKGQIQDITTREDIRNIAWQYDGQFPGWKGYFNRQAGYAHASNALLAVYKAAAANGVKFILGKDRGWITELIHSPNSKKITALRTHSGTTIPTTLTIVATGAAAATLIPTAASQIVAKSWSLAHIHLTDDETSALRNIPVTYARDLGFFFEPDPVTNWLKICPMGGGYVNTDPVSGRSLPPKTLAESDVLPVEDEGRIRRLLREALPGFEGRELVGKKLCWFADTRDSEFVVDYVPGMEGSVVMLSGDSGHLFKMLPIAGGWVKGLVEEGGQGVARWQWKEGKGQDDGKGDVSWRLGETREFADIKKLSKL
ncbi:NAD(P)/FAD-dependent oxidoreductase [Aspergillus glaucus CBS 516.65]|uniref:FAD dependent oxidoreductase domain-containing protein n=1 Tax=Aspergillus glaucus CBS 516.65 TaxID=1160497 RepID=A0A1L9VXG1_ASPGL|nr:hypothetical protein ASPGLDRAFT_117085 [Aspergillus glaucus CBS 516.65]OJJ88579.1 hypothetical protein ASPGLDRAFT_117085 [Aspergillus glaucus CBS 516.65]